MSQAKRCVLHIGLEKTGSTAIQNYLSKNRDLLYRKGFLYPEQPGRSNHTALTAFCLNSDKVDDVRVVHGISSSEDVPQFREKFRRKFLSELKANTAHTVILSNEHLSSRLKEEREILRMRGICQWVAPKTQIVIYIRNQADFLVSWYSTSVKGGNTKSFPIEKISAHRGLLDYCAIVDRWARVFGPDAISVRFFSREKEGNLSAEAEFCRSLNIDTREFEGGRDLNKSLSPECIAFLREVNKRIPRIVDNRLNPERGRIVGMLEQYESSKRFLIPETWANRIVDEFELSNELLRRRYMPDVPPPLFGKPKSSDASLLVSNDQMDEPDFLSIFSDLWRRTQRRLLTLQARLDA